MLRLVRITLLALLSALLLLLTAACGGDDDGSTDSAPTTTEAAPTETGSGGDHGGDGNDASAELEDYFAKMDRFLARRNTRLEVVDAELSNATFDSDAEEIAAAQNALQERREAIDTAFSDMSSLSADDPPPEEVWDAHNKLLLALNAFLQPFSDMDTDISEDVSTSVELAALSERYSDDFARADKGFNEACLALQGIADEHAIEADMHCND